MNELLVLRHAKSDWNAGAQNDHSRPLNRRGQDAAQKIGAFAANAGRQPDAILSSTSLRTRQTVELACHATGWPETATFVDDLYGADVQSWLKVVSRDAPSSSKRLLVVGHEPTCSAVLHHLTGASVRFPTAGLAAISLSEPWSGIQRCHGQLLWFVVPRLLE